jgi:hypothetical protein
MLVLLVLVSWLIIGTAVSFVVGPSLKRIAEEQYLPV